MKTIKQMLWFLRESCRFMNMSFWKILQNKGLKRAVYFVKSCKHDDMMKKKYGVDWAYAIADRTLVIGV